MSSAITIPNRFESLQAEFNEYRPLIVPIEEDLKAYMRLRERARLQNGGLLCFLLGPSGIGKTTSAHSAVVNAPEIFTRVVLVPHDVDFRECSAWLATNTPAAVTGKCTIVLFDGREASDDDVGVRQFLSTLNQFLRRRPDVLFCWPTTDDDWHAKLRALASNIGGANFCPAESDYLVRGPTKSDWPLVLERLLLQFQKSLDDVGMSGDLVSSFITKSNSVGDFLNSVSFALAERLSARQSAKRLPTLLFIISSSGDVAGECNRIRRAGKQVVAAEPLLGHSPRSEAGKWWAARNSDPNHHLGYIISLFNANLVTMTPSSVVHACMLHAELDLRDAATKAGALPNKGSAGQALKASELFRFLNGESVPEFTTGKRGRAQDTTISAYAAIQALSLKRHKSINMAICKFIEEQSPSVKVDQFEVSQGGDLVTDAILESSGRLYHGEFHHVSLAQCKASTLASYIMDKLRTYAIYHQLIPR